MKLTEEQKEIVERNIGLVGKVIADKVHGTNQYRIFSYDDFYQIGCIGLCKAAATDKGGCFSTYAYRMIWNEICDALIYVNRRTNSEFLSDWDMEHTSSYEAFKQEDDSMALKAALMRAKEGASPCVRKGIDALLLKVHGYSGREIGDRYGVSERLVGAWIAKARKYLRTNQIFLQEI